MFAQDDVVLLCCCVDLRWTLQSLLVIHNKECCQVFVDLVVKSNNFQLTAIFLNGLFGCYTAIANPQMTIDIKNSYSFKTCLELSLSVQQHSSSTGFANILSIFFDLLFIISMRDKCSVVRILHGCLHMKDPHMFKLNRCVNCSLRETNQSLYNNS